MTNGFTAQRQKSSPAGLDILLGMTLLRRIYKRIQEHFLPNLLAQTLHCLLGVTGKICLQFFDFSLLWEYIGGYNSSLINYPAASCGVLPRSASVLKQG